MGEVIIKAFQMILLFLFGALCIDLGIKNYEEKRYFSFGISVMTTTWTIVTLINSIIL